MKIKTIEKYWYIFLVILVLITIFFLQEKTPTSQVILNLHNLNSSYELENPSKIKINITISEENKITGSIVLNPNSSAIIEQKNFMALGEEYEE